MNLMFTCNPSGFVLAVSSLRRSRWLWSWANRLISEHQRGCPYCLFEKDTMTGREVGG